MSAVKITENEGRVNAQVSEASHVSQSVANQKLPDTLGIRGRRARIVIREIPHILTIRVPRALIRRREARNWPTVLDRFARSHADDVVLSAVSDTTHLPRRRTICPFKGYLAYLCRSHYLSPRPHRAGWHGMIFSRYRGPLHCQVGFDWACGKPKLYRPY